jgi:DNA-binding Xre family transcriptional regulator
MGYAAAAVTATLKRALKKRRISYRELGKRLRLSESGVKKMMTAGDLSLDRLAAICAAVPLDLADVLDGALRAPPAPFSFAPAQEKFLAENPGDAAFFTALVTAGFDTGEVERRYRLDRTSMRIYLGRLEKHGFIERVDGGGARSRFGPLEYMRGRAMTDLTLPSLERALAAAPADRCVRTGRVRLTAENLARFNREILDLLLRYAVIARRDALEVRDDQLVDVWVIAATARQHLSDVLAIPRRTR